MTMEKKHGKSHGKKSGNAPAPAKKSFGSGTKYGDKGKTKKGLG